MIYKGFRKIILLPLIISIILLTGCNNTKQPLGSLENPIKMYFMPGEGSKESFAKNVDIFKNFLEKETKYTIKPTISSDYITIIEGFGYRKVDIAFINTLGYILATDCCRAESALMFLHGDSLQTYKGAIITHKDSDIKKLEDINGKTFAFVNPYSTSGFLLPLKLFQDKNIKPSKTINANYHFKVVSMVYKKEVEAGAIYYSPPENSNIKDARHELIDIFPDVSEKVKIIDYTEEIPNNPVAFQKDIPEEIKNKLSDSIVKFSRTPQGEKSLKEMYEITGFKKVRDIEYDIVRKFVKSLGKDVEDFIPDGFKIYAKKVRFREIDIP